MKTFLSGHRRTLTWLVYFFSAIAIWYCLNHPYFNFHLHIAQGDHGNNFYAFRRTFEGALPYRDYWWVYGPLMPYYYSFFYHLFGVNMHSVLLGYHFLNLLCGLVMAAIIARFFPLFMALSAATFYWVYSPHFAHTFNHIGGILMIFLMLYNLWVYIQTKRIGQLYGALTSVFILAFIKLNFGLAMLVGLTGSVWIIDRILKIIGNEQKRRFYFIAIVLAPLAILLGYGYFLRGLSWEAIRQCILFLDTDPNHIKLEVSLQDFINYLRTLNARLGLKPFDILSILGGGYFIFLLIRKKLAKPFRSQIIAGLAATLFLSLCSLHEFIPTGIGYRLLWLEPLRQLAMFMVFFAILIQFPMGIRLLVCFFLVLLPLGNHLMRYQYFETYKEFIPLDRGKIYISNSEPWLSTVMTTTKFLNENLKPDENFLALTSDELYYFLTDRNSPTRLSDLSVDVSPRQEQEMIAALEAQKIRYILVSNRYRNPETGRGAFGVAYCQQLSAYLHLHFVPIVVFGEWDKTADWFSNHGVLILKRVDGSVRAAPGIRKW